MYRITVLVSGGGTNLQAIMDAIADGRITDTEIACVISNNRDAYALTRAYDAGIPACVVSRADHPHRDEYDAALTRAVVDTGADLVVLAGFLVKIPPAMIREFKNRIINIHPSLIPSFCGVGFYGLKVHEAALARGVRLTGATVHVVDEDTDTGPILLQKAVEIQPGDTPEVLQRRVMEQAEWKLLPQAIDMLAHGRIEISDEGQVTFL
ncbi:MAG: phosphoribosylglycinamide formyltransferase [Lachnospiraceae bacterium]|nr:phosphoribosylglycinamide formyltransferase [Lachnospiraceae bacterium]